MQIYIEVKKVQNGFNWETVPGPDGNTPRVAMGFAPTEEILNKNILGTFPPTQYKLVISNNFSQVFLATL